MNKKILVILVLVLTFVFTTKAVFATLTLGSTTVTGSDALTVIGGSSASQDLTLSSTSDSTKGKILFGTSAYDEVNNRLGIGTTTPRGILETVEGSVLLGGKAGGDNLPNVLSILANQNTATGDSSSDLPIMINHTGGGSATNLFYVTALSDTDATNYSTMVGIESDIYTGLKVNDAAASTITPWSGVLSIARGIAGNVANVSSSTGTINSAFGGYFQVTNSATGIIRSAYGLYTGVVSATGTDTGQTHNAYGLYIANNITATGGAANNSYALYSASTAKSYLAGSLGIGVVSPNASVALDVTSTTKAFMPPRMTTTQRDAISGPTAGMVIYNSTTNKLNVYTTAWEAVTSS